MFTKQRAIWNYRLWNTPELHQLEKKYGKYIYLPLDVPKIIPDNQEEFV